MADSRKLKHKLNPLQLALLGVRRNRKKTLVTIVSLALSGVLLACAATYFSSISLEKMVRGNSHVYGEFFIDLSSEGQEDSDGYSLGHVQENNPMPALVDRLDALDGVTGIKVESGTTTYFSAASVKRSQADASGYTPDDVPRIQKLMKDGTCSYEELVEKQGVILSIAGTMAEIYPWQPVVGETVILEFYTKDGIIEKEFTIMGLTDARVKEGVFILPEEVLAEITGFDNTCKLYIDADPDKIVDVNAALWELIGSSPQFYLSTMTDLKATQAGMASNFMMVAYFLVAIMMVFSIISLCNTILSNILSRKQELSMMQAVGMTSRQLAKMVQFEGSIYTLCTAVFTLTVGSAAGYLVCRVINAIDVNPYLEYQFPLVPILVFLGLLLVLQVVISEAALRTYRNQSLVERMKEMEG